MVKTHQNIGLDTVTFVKKQSFLWGRVTEVGRGPGMLGGEGEALVEKSTRVLDILAHKKCLPNKRY